MEKCFTDVYAELLLLPNYFFFMFLASPRREINRFWKLVILLILSNSNLKFILLTLGKSELTLFFHSTTKTSRNQYNKNSRTTHRIWRKLFSMIQPAGIKNWCLQLIGFKGSVFNLCNTFFWFLQQNKICMIRKKTQEVLENWGKNF